MRAHDLVGNVYLSLHRPGLRGGDPGVRVRRPFGRAAGIKALLHDRRWAEPCVLRGALRGGGLRVGSAAGFHPGGGHRSTLPAADDGAKQIRCRRRHCRGVRLGPGHRHHRHQPHNRHDHRCGQLYVRLHSGPESGGCGVERGAECGCAGALRPVLPPAFRHHF